MKKATALLALMAAAGLLLPGSSAMSQNAKERPLLKRMQESRAAGGKERPAALAEDVVKALQNLIGSAGADAGKRNQLMQDLSSGKGIDTGKASVRLTLPFVSKQHDGWSCGLHTATRILKYNNYDASYEKLKLQRKITTLQFDSNQGPYTLPPGLQSILRSFHPDSWWLTGVDMNVIKNLLRQKKPVAALVMLPGKSLRVNVAGHKIKAPATHWVTVSGFDDRLKKIYYYDPMKTGVQQSSYDDFLEVWAARPGQFQGKGFNPLLLSYGFIASRTIAFCN